MTGRNATPLAIEAGDFAVQILSPMEKWMFMIGANDEPIICRSQAEAQRLADAATGGFIRVLINLAPGEWGSIC